MLLAVNHPGEYTVPATRRAPAIENPPSLVDLAATTLRRMIISGELRCGQRIIENRLTRELGISRPPLREALRVLEREGLVRQLPRRGVIVTPLTLHDIYEICTLRTELQQLAIRLGVPVRHPARLQRCRRALQHMRTAARAHDQPDYLDWFCEFHLSLVGLAGHRRLEEAYRSLQLQLMLTMALNQQLPAGPQEVRADFTWHEHLLRTIEGGDPDQVLAVLTAGNDHAFLDGIENKVDGHTDVALRWLRHQRTREAV
jgi:DNA-binding GntR family transcriptional regulator